MIISIHQPNFFPWIGFFNKISNSDKFVFLTQSQRSKNDKFLTKTRILDNSKNVRYLSIPLGNKQPMIIDLEMPSSSLWKKKFLNIIKESYRNTPFFDHVYPDIEYLINQEERLFYKFSSNIVLHFLEKFNIKTQTFFDYSIGENFGVSNERNISICKKLNATKYFSGDGARVYNDEVMFRDANLQIVYQNYNQPKYNQNSETFKSGLSIIDSLFNCGYLETKKLINMKSYD